ncbi:unnamed protein product [Heligmosomoides polygyrus]|uniref:PRORP domain-containing protein n=1 Tax=Heligmosomoides polygyrus TaxID=6339 RepID=A0A183GHJ4_HELPZ|nr:unnamed protein product [Heligmosomoides polygyrus]
MEGLVVFGRKFEPRSWNWVHATTGASSLRYRARAAVRRDRNAREDESQQEANTRNVPFGHAALPRNTSWRAFPLSPELALCKSSLSAEYSNAVIVTRPFLAEKLKSVRWRGRVRVFACTSLSEDDLLLLLAAVEWGPNAYVLSNDRFGIHMERASRSGGLLLKEWMRRRILRFSRQNWHYDSLPKYGEFVQLIAAGVYFVPVSEETPEIPQRSAYLVPISV